MSRKIKVLITGGTDGIGNLLAKKLSQTKGTQIIITGQRKKFISNNKNITYIQANQNNPQLATKKIIATLKKLKWKKLDYAILNAGVGKVGNPFCETSQQLEQQVNVNLISPIFIAQALAPFLLGNTITFIGSVAHKGNSNFASYAATKAGLHSLVRSLLQEWQGKIKVQIIHIAATKTNMHEKAGIKFGKITKLFANIFFANPDSMVKAIEKTLKKKSGIYNISTLKTWGQL